MYTIFFWIFDKWSNRHQAVNLYMTKTGDLFDQWKHFFWRNAKLALFTGDINFNQDIHQTVLFCCFCLDCFCKSKRINGMNQCCFSNQILNFISLKMADHMPWNIFWKFFIFVSEFLYFVLAELPDTKVINFLQHRNRLRFAHCNQCNIFRMSTTSFAGIFHLVLYRFQIFFQHILHSSSFAVLSFDLLRMCSGAYRNTTSSSFIPLPSSAMRS